MEGRKAWTMLTVASQNLARNIWINADEREGHEKDDLIAKVFVFSILSLVVVSRTDLGYRTALNLIVAFAQSLKHRLRFEPYTHYNDLSHLVQHFDSFAKEATKLETNRDKPRPTFWKSWGSYLGLTFTMSNPRKIVKQAKYPLGNLPLEILNHLTVYIHDVIDYDGFKTNVYHTQACEYLFRCCICFWELTCVLLFSKRSFDYERRYGYN
jgi:putative membrane protein